MKKSHRPSSTVTGTPRPAVLNLVSAQAKRLLTSQLRPYQERSLAVQEADQDGLEDVGVVPVVDPELDLGQVGV